MSPTAGFEESVVKVVASIRRGDVLTYGEVAEEAGHPGAARAVGNLLHNSAQSLPWWRVVGSGGRLLAPERSRQAKLLADEGWKVEERRIRI